MYFRYFFWWILQWCSFISGDTYGTSCWWKLNYMSASCLLLNRLWSFQRSGEAPSQESRSHGCLKAGVQRRLHWWCLVNWLHRALSGFPLDPRWTWSRYCFGKPSKFLTEVRKVQKSPSLLNIPITPCCRRDAAQRIVGFSQGDIWTGTRPRSRFPGCLRRDALHMWDPVTFHTESDQHRVTLSSGSRPQQTFN